jgi:hypothetical protein
MIEIPDTDGIVACVRCDGYVERGVEKIPLVTDHVRGPNVLADYLEARRNRES